MAKLKNILKIGDLILIGLLSLVIIVSFLTLHLLRINGEFVSIYVEGNQIYRLSLKEDTEIKVNGIMGVTRIRVQKGSVTIVEAPCPNKICKKMGKISRSGEILVCVPNRLVLRITGKMDSEIDAITM